MLLRSTLILLVLATVLTAGSPQAAGALGANGEWSGTYTLAGGKDAVAVTVAGRGATVGLGAGHASVQDVRVTRRGSAVRFALPGRPSALTFSGRLVRGRLTGTVRLGSGRGTFSLRRGRAPGVVARGLYGSDGRLAVVDDPFGPARLVDLGSGEVHALYPAGRAFRIGSGFATRDPVVGTATFSVAAARVRGASAPRVAPRQLEVRFPTGDAVLAGTLTLPPGAGPHPAVAWVHGSGFTNRAYLPDLPALLVHHGVAVLAYDKRGVGQSSGTYPGESPTQGAIDVLARDAAAAVRFLAAQPEVDAGRVGLAGHSQAGWIMPLAASREPAVRFLVAFSGPAVTADENDVYQDLSGAGERPAQLSDDQIDAEVLRRGPSGYDPLPSIRSLAIPSLWVYGGRDRHIPPRLSARRLAAVAAEPGGDLTVAVFPNANHALVETQTGLTEEMLRSSTFAPGLFASVGSWLASHRLGTASGR